MSCAVTTVLSSLADISTSNKNSRCQQKNFDNHSILADPYKPNASVIRTSAKFSARRRSLEDARAVKRARHPSCERKHCTAGFKKNAVSATNSLILSTPDVLMTREVTEVQESPKKNAKSNEGTVDFLEAPLEHSEEFLDSSSFLVKSTTFKHICHGVLNSQLVSALRTKFGFEHPTYVQARVLPSFLLNKNVILRAQTGSGKTLAYVVPILHHILETHDFKATPYLKSVIFVPTRELCHQVCSVFSQLCCACYPFIPVKSTAESTTENCKGALPLVLIATPKAFVSYIKARAATFRTLETKLVSQLKHVVIDEADCMLDLGYESDFSGIVETILTPSTFKDRQVFICSATLSFSNNQFYSAIVHKPVTFDLSSVFSKPGSSANTDASVPPSTIQYYYKCSINNKYLVLYSLIKLALLPMKCLIFSESPDEAHGLGYFLQKFGIAAAVISSDLPFHARQALIQSLNQGILQILIATDEAFEGPEMIETTTKRKGKRDREYGAQRGIDFRDVNCVVNFSVPRTLKLYIHRIGRTGRAGGTGFALTFVTPDSLSERLFQSYIENPGVAIHPLQLELKDVECFRYRVEDILKTITPKKITALRALHLKKQFLQSKKLREYVKQNPDDVKQLRSALSAIQQAKQQQTRKHLTVIPNYFKTSIDPVMTKAPIQLKIQAMPVENNYVNINSELFKRSIPGSYQTNLLKQQLSKEVDYSVTAPQNLEKFSNRRSNKVRKKLFKKAKMFRRLKIKHKINHTKK